MDEKYKNCKIEKTGWRIPKTFYCTGSKYYKYLYLYKISGQVYKSAETRPFLTSIKNCKDFIDSRLKSRTQDFPLEETQTNN